MSKIMGAIRAAMKASGETPYRIAKGSGVHKAQLSRFLSGERGLSIETAETLATYLRLRITIEPTGKARKGK